MGPGLGVNVWRYTISTGAMENGLGQAFVGYSGKGMWRDDPDSVREVGLGPIPPGTYRIGSPRNHPRLGVLSMALTPVPGTDTFGRSGFFIHGDNAAANKSASSGCIVLNRLARSYIASGLAHRDFLVVIP